MLGVVLYGLGLVLYGLFCIPFCVVMMLYEGLKYCAKSEFVQFLFSIIVVYVLARAALRLLLRLIAAAARCALVIGLILSPVIALAILNPAGTSAADMFIQAGIGSAISQAALQQIANHPVIATTVVGIALAPVLGPTVLGAAGFTANGVAAGSLAAGVHSMIGNVIAGSTFAGAQAARATGIIPATGLAIAGGVGGAAALVASSRATRFQSGLLNVPKGSWFAFPMSYMMTHQVSFVAVAFVSSWGTCNVLLSASSLHLVLDFCARVSQVYEAAVVAGTLVTGLVLTPLLGPAVLGVVGFQAGGVAAGTAAAAIQAGIGNVAAGSIFAGAQAAAATGAIPAVGMAVGGAVGGAATFIASLF
ncbi:hypothetical protein EV122DRAFT_273580 [Schizophyllum commune]